MSPCCQTADPEELRTDPTAYNCDSCLVRHELDELAPENVAAWDLFRSLCTRFLVETSSVSIALSRLTADLSPEDFADLTRRLSILYTAHYPPPKAPDHGA